MKYEACQYCNGTGKQISQKHLGSELRTLRIERGLSLRDVAKKMGFTPPYVSDLELGRRNWKADLIDSFKKAISLSDGGVFRISHPPSLRTKVGKAWNIAKNKPPFKP